MSCYDNTTDCAAGATISLSQPIRTSCESQWEGGFCGAVGSAQRVTGCCVAEGHDEFGNAYCANQQITTYNCCGADTVNTCTPTGSYTLVNAPGNPTACTNPNDTYVSHYSDPSAGVAFQECGSYKPNGECYAGEMHDVYNVRTTCNTVSCTCAPVCTQTAPTNLSIVAGTTPGTTASVSWTIGANGVAQYLWIDETAAEVAAGCPTSGACMVSSQLPNSTSSLLMSGLTPLTTYYFRVVNIGSNEGCYSEVSGTYTTPASSGAISGYVYLDTSNSCLTTPFAGQGVTLDGVTTLVSDGSGAFSVNAALAATHTLAVTIPSGYTCSTGAGCNSCSKTGVVSPSANNYFYLTQNRDAWWQVEFLTVHRL